MPYYIGLDLGTTTVTGVLWDTVLGRVSHLVQRPNDASSDACSDACNFPSPTRAEQDPLRLRALALEILAELVDRQPAAAGQTIGGIAVTGQMHGLLCIDNSGQPLTPLISWQDQRSAEPLPDGSTMLDQIHERIADLDWHQNGCRITHGYGAATLYWLVQQAGLPVATERVCTLADWLAGQLCGCPPATDPTLAASWGIYSLLDGGWNAAFLDRLDLPPRLFPPVRPSGERLGGLAPLIAQQVGLPAGVPVFNALGDSQASFLGSIFASQSFPSDGRRSPDRGPGIADPAHAIFLNLGTGGQICWMIPAFEPPSEKVETRPLPPGRFLRVGASLCGGEAYAWLNRTVREWLSQFGVEVDAETVYRRLDTLAAACKDARGLCVRTTFLGVRGDPSVQTGAIEGITLDNLTLSALARATATGIVDELHALYKSHAGGSAQHTHVLATGGGVYKNPLLPGLIEERFGLPVRVPPQRETAALGAAMLVAGGNIDPTAAK